MTHADDLTARESEIIRIVKVLSAHTSKFILIGGYAVSTLASHRFSVDCDIVISGKDLILFGNILKKEGYRKLKTTRQTKEIYGVKVREYTKLIVGRRVTVDLFVDSILCRQTGGRWGYDLLMENSIRTNVVGLTDSAVSLVPKKELLIAMKIHSGRDADLRDVIMLSEGADWQSVARFASCGNRKKAIRQTESAIATIGKKEFPSALRAEFSLRSDATPLIKRTVQGLKTVKKLLPTNLKLTFS